MDRACSTKGGRRKVHAGVWWEKLKKKRDFLEDSMVGRLMLQIRKCT
jgi:hypothetical protein